MRNIQVRRPEKYDSDRYTEVENNIYQDSEDNYYVTTLAFEQEPELGEGPSPAEISQYPLEDILDKFYLHVSDFYEAENAASDTTCVLEFSGADIDDVRGALSLVGKHVYNRNSGDRVILVVE